MEPSVREVRWSFAIVAACGIALAATICWGIVHKINQSDAIVRIAASSADQVERLNSQIDSLRADYSAAQEASTRLEAQNERLIRVNRQQRAQLKALLTYLREHGLSVPQPRTAYEPEPPAPKATAAHSGTPPTTTSPASPAPTPHQSPSPSPSPRPSSPRPTKTPPAPTTPTRPLVCTLLPLVCH
jgi:outer membrane biosynthesis protein TonB